MTAVSPTKHEIGAIWCPLELKQHSEPERFQARSEQFFLDLGLNPDQINTARATSTGALACWWAPTGSTEGVQLLSDWLMWALLFDDTYCDVGSASRDPLTFIYTAARTMNRSLYPSDPSEENNELRTFELSLQDMFARIDRLAGGQASQECATAHFSWMVGAACGVSDRHHYHMRSLDDHLVVRPMDGGDLVSGYLIQVAEGRWLDSDLRCDPAVRAISNAAGVLLTVPTDLASYGRERRQDSLHSNIVAIIQREQSCTTREALDLSRHLIEEMMQLFVDLKAKLQERRIPQLDLYLEDLSNMVRGTLEWQRLLPRYALPDSVVRESRSGVFEVDPLHEVTTQRQFSNNIRIPRSIQWWWQAL